MNFSTLCTILVAFGPETSEFTLITLTPFAAIRQKSAYHAKYLRISWTYMYLDIFYRCGSPVSGDNYSNIRLAVAQGKLLWQPVKFGRFHTTFGNVARNDLYSLFWHSTTDWPSVNPFSKGSMSIIRLHRVWPCVKNFTTLSLA